MITDTIQILGQSLTLAQIKGGFYTSMDSVMLAAACPAKPQDTLLDLGCGVGGAGLAVLHRIKDTQLTGIDIQDDHIALAHENAARNGMKAAFITADIREFSPEHCFNHVICNPPYLDGGAHIRSPSAAKATAMGHDEATLQDWIDCAYKNLKSRGSLTMIHQAGQTDKILQAMGDRFGATEIIPLWPRVGTSAKRVIIRSYKNRKSPASIHAGLVLHQKNGDYTAEAEKILRDAAPLL